MVFDTPTSSVYYLSSPVELLGITIGQHQSIECLALEH